MAVRMEVEIPELDELRRLYAQAPAQTEAEAQRAMQESVAYLEGQVKLRTPVVSGTLRRDIKGRATSMGPVVLGLVWSGRKYAKPVEYGARARTIYPRNKKALYWKGAKHPVAKVNWPGFPGRFMFKKGLEASRGMIQQFFRQAFERVIAFVEGR